MLVARRRALSLLPYALRVFGRNIAGLTIFCAGCAFAWSGIATKLAANDFQLGAVAARRAVDCEHGARLGVGTLSEMSALQARPGDPGRAGRVRDSDGDPGVVAPLLFGEQLRRRRRSGGVAARRFARAARRGRGRARALAAAARADGRASASSASSGSAASPPRRRLRRRAVRARTAAEPSSVDDEHVAGARSGAEAAARSRVSRSAPLTGVAPSVRASTSWPTESPPRRLQVVEAVVQAERVRLRVQRRARVRTQRSGEEPGTSGSSSSPSRAQPRDALASYGTPASSANETWMPRAASCEAIDGRSAPDGARTISADGGLVGVRRASAGARGGPWPRAP